MNIVYLFPKSGYATDLSSDTLWGTLCWGVRHLWDWRNGDNNCAFNKFLATYLDKNTTPEFIISSAFPFKQHEGQKILFFPNPLRAFPQDDSDTTEEAMENHRLRKAFKKIRYVSQTDFEKILKGEFTETDLLNRLRKEKQFNDTAEEAEIENSEKILKERKVYTAPRKETLSMTHNTIDRLRGGTLSILDGDESAGQLFHADEYSWVDKFNESGEINTGLYFLVEGDIAKLKPLLSFFRHWGIGADRTNGKGVFDYSIEEFTLAEPAESDTNALLNLSLYHPTEDEFSGFESPNGFLQYNLVRRQGYIGQYDVLLEKHPRRYFGEGSIFRKPLGFSGRYLGMVRPQPKYVCESLDHPVYDYGIGFMVHLKWDKQ